MSDDPAGQASVADARAYAYRYLGAREHSCQELRDKLLRKGVPRDIAHMAVDELAEEGLVSDQRYAEAFARSRIERHQGPFKIRAELRKRGVPDAVVEEALSAQEPDWRDLALSWARKRQRGELDQKEKARLYRSGCGRGFSHEQMMRVIEALESEAP
ncbi:MAG: regulatory protein RecX [Xanthomonadales bacterium]|nr:regulatory protein RecX [Xanthomonadales bacterium]